MDLHGTNRRGDGASRQGENMKINDLVLKAIAFECDVPVIDEAAFPMLNTLALKKLARKIIERHEDGILYHEVKK